MTSGITPDSSKARAVANVPTLLCVLVQLTGDARWLEDPYRPTRNRGLGDNTSGGLPEAVHAEVEARPGGPRAHAERVARREARRVDAVERRMRQFEANPHAEPGFWKPTPLLARLAAADGTFNASAGGAE